MDPCGVAVDALSVPASRNVEQSTGTARPVRVALGCSGGSLTYAIASEPKHGEISSFDPATGTLTYTPDAGFMGEDSFTYRASNAVGESNTATATITVITPPSCEDISRSTRYDQPADVTLECSGQGTLTYEVVTQPADGEISDLDPSAGTLTYTPASGFTGRDSFTYRASTAGVDSNTATATIAISPPPPPPPSNQFAFGKLKQQKRKGRARLWLDVPGPGVAELAGERIKHRKQHTAGPQRRLSVAPIGRAKRKLKRKSMRKGRAEMTVRVDATYTPDRGSPRTESRKLKLKRRRR